METSREPGQIGLQAEKRMSPEKGSSVGERPQTPLFSFGVITDVQYADVDNSLSCMNRMRYFREALYRLREAVQDWNNCPNGHTVNFALQLGDVIDGRNKPIGQSQLALDKVMAEINAFNGPVHHTWGNHEFYNFSRQELLQMCLNSAPTEKENGLKSRSYYCFSPHPDFLFIMLDTYTKSVLGYDTNHPTWQESDAFLRSMRGDVDLNDFSGRLGPDKRHFQVYNGGVDEEQLGWLEMTLAEAYDRGQKVIVCGHQPIHRESCDPGGMCWNYESILSVLHQSGCVLAYLCGHDHGGGTHRDNHGILHVTFPGVVEARPGQNDFGTVNVYTDRMELHGHGRVPSITMATWQT